MYNSLAMLSNEWIDLQSLLGPSFLALVTSPPAVAVLSVAVISIFYIYYNLPTAPTTGPDRPRELLELLNNNKDVYYFGVGSNLSRTRLENRSISGQKIHPISMEPCLIYDCRLAFNLMAAPPFEPVMGSLEPLPSFFEKKDAKRNHPTILKRTESSALIAYNERECHGALIKLSAHDYELVHVSEGGGMGALSGYEEIMVECVPYDKSKPTVKAVAFRTREYRCAEQDLCPSKRYMDIIRTGAAELGLADSYQKWLEEHPVQPKPSRILKIIGKYNLLFTFTLSHRWKMPLLQNVQRLLLFGVYVLPTEPRWKQMVSEFAALVIMFPGAVLGLLSKTILGERFIPDVMLKWIQSLD